MYKAKLLISLQSALEEAQDISEQLIQEHTSTDSTSTTAIDILNVPKGSAILEAGCHVVNGGDYVSICLPVTHKSTVSIVRNDNNSVNLRIED